MSYVRFARLREALGEVELVDAREAPDLVASYSARGYPIDEGMIVDTGEEIYFGGDAVYAINWLASPNPVMRWFGGRAFLKFIYPALRAVRNLTVRLLGHKPIQNSAP